MPINAGEMTKRITFQRPVRVTDEAGAPATEWREVGKAWAEEITLSANKRAQAPKEMAVRTSTFRMRYRVVDSEWRIIYGGGTWHILGISPRREDGSVEVMAEWVSVEGTHTSPAVTHGW